MVVFSATCTQLVRVANKGLREEESIRPIVEGPQFGGKREESFMKGVRAHRGRADMALASVSPPRPNKDIISHGY